MERRDFLATSLCAAVGAPLTPALGPFEFPLEEATVTMLSFAMLEGGVTSERLVRLYLDRIAAYDDTSRTLNAVLALNPKAIEQAAALDAEFNRGKSRGPLHGLPVLIKDNVDAVDMPTSNGSAVLARAMPPDDAFLVKALREAGAVILGKAAMGEFAGGSYNSVGGQTVNPYHLKRQTGGSSSGTGAAIAANFAVVGVGTDTSTSVRAPAAYNGLVGLRPTTGLISRDGIAPKNLLFDTAGPMARTVMDAAILLSAMAGPDPADPLSQRVWSEVNRREGASGRLDYTVFCDPASLAGARIGVMRDFWGSDAENDGDPEIDALANRVLRVLQGRGAQLVDVALPAKIRDRYLGAGAQEIRRIADYRFRADFEAYLATLRGDVPRTVEGILEAYERDVMPSPLPVEDSVMRLLRDSLAHSAEEPAYRRLVEETLVEATEDKLALFSDHGVDALVFPYQTSFAAPIRNPAYAVDDPTFVPSGRPQPAVLAGYASVGFPAIVVPMGNGSQGLPMGISFMGRPYEESRLVAYAYAFEQSGAYRRPPPLVPSLPGELIG